MKKLLGAGFLFTAIASAQVVGTVTITYSLNATPAPTTILLTALGLLAAFALYRKARRIPVGMPLAALLLALGLGSLYTAKAYITVPTASMTGAGPLVFNMGSGQLVEVINNTGSTETINGIYITGGPTLVGPSAAPPCSVGLTLANGGYCYVQTAGTVTAQPVR